MGSLPDSVRDGSIVKNRGTEWRLTGLRIEHESDNAREIIADHDRELLADKFMELSTWLRPAAQKYEPRWTKHVLRPWIVTLWRACVFALYNHGVTNTPIYWLRKVYLRVFCGIVFGNDTSIHMGCFVTGRQIKVGNNSVINRRCYLDGRGGIEVGNNVSISPEVYILTATHPVNDPKFNMVTHKVTIEDNVWVGARAFILPKITLGQGCVVGAGAVVTKSVLPYQIVGGNPARVLGERNKDLQYQLSYFPMFDTDEVLPKLFRRV